MNRPMDRVSSINRGMSDMRPLESVDIPPMKDKVSDEELAILVVLACA